MTEVLEYYILIISGMDYSTYEDVKSHHPFKFKPTEELLYPDILKCIKKLGIYFDSDIHYVELDQIEYNCPILDGNEVGRDDPQDSYYKDEI